VHAIPHHHDALGRKRRDARQRVCDHLALLDALSVQEAADDQIEVLGEIEVVEDALREDGRLRRRQPDAYLRVAQVAKQSGNSRVDLVLVQTLLREVLP